MKREEKRGKMKTRKQNKKRQKRKELTMFPESIFEDEDLELDAAEEMMFQHFHWLHNGDGDTAGPRLRKALKRFCSTARSI